MNRELVDHGQPFKALSAQKGLCVERGSIPYSWVKEYRSTLIPFYIQKRLCAIHNAYHQRWLFLSQMTNTIQKAPFSSSKNKTKSPLQAIKALSRKDKANRISTLLPIIVSFFPNNKEIPATTSSSDLLLEPRICRFRLSKPHPHKPSYHHRK